MEMHSPVTQLKSSHVYLFFILCILYGQIVSHTAKVPQIQLFITTLTATTIIALLDYCNNLLTLLMVSNSPK